MYTQFLLFALINLPAVKSFIEHFKEVIKNPKLRVLSKKIEETSDHNCTNNSLINGAFVTIWVWNSTALQKVYLDFFCTIVVCLFPVDFLQMAES